MYGLLRLTRWRDHLPFTIPLTLLGGLLSGAALDWRLAAVTGANALAVTFAFAFNDLEDAPDDARDPVRAKTNAVANHAVSVRAGVAFCWVLAGAATALYIGAGATAIGAAILTLGMLYSWKAVRLKAIAVADVLSHALMLAGLLVFGGAFIYRGDTPLLDTVWLVAAGLTLISAYGQFHNQLRDDAADRAAGLHTTSIVLGPRVARTLMLASAGAGFALLAVAGARGAFPGWLGGVALAGLVIGLALRPTTDARGSHATEPGARLQLVGYFTLNLTVLVWLAQVIFSSAV